MVVTICIISSYCPSLLVVYGYSGNKEDFEILPENVKHRVLIRCKSAEMRSTADGINIYPYVSFKTEGESPPIGGGEVVSEDKLEVKTNVYLNPFSETATFTFELKETLGAKIVVYDLSGKVIKIVANCEFFQGANKVQWNGNNNSDALAAAGVYF